jgi:hypothetical protein
LKFTDTPGHARHHFCVHDSLTNSWFTGDTFGLSYRIFDTHKGAFLIPTTTPIQFDPEALKKSVKMLSDSRPEYLYLTHYGRVGNVQQLATQMIHGVDTFAEIGEHYKDAPGRTDKIEAAMTQWLKRGLNEHGVNLPVEQSLKILRFDVVLNTQGIEFWLDHRHRWSQ